MLEQDASDPQSYQTNRTYLSRDALAKKETLVDPFESFEPVEGLHKHDQTVYCKPKHISWTIDNIENGNNNNFTLQYLI